jgi:hypothetical protein
MLLLTMLVLQFGEKMLTTALKIRLVVLVCGEEDSMKLIIVICTIMGWGFSLLVAFRFIGIGLVGVGNRAVESIVLFWLIVSAAFGFVLGFFQRNPPRLATLSIGLPLVGASFLALAGAVERMNTAGLWFALEIISVGVCLVFSIFGGSWLRRGIEKKNG